MKRSLAIILALCLALTSLCTLVGCDKEDEKTPRQFNIIDDDYRVYYEIFVGSFYDSNGDGYGDLNGIIEKLDYLNDGDPASEDSLHVGGIWLMPIMPSPTYHKYDAIDFYSVDRNYGTLDDFKRLVEECNNRNIDLIIDLMINHTSNSHPWFKSACKSIGIEPCGEEVCTYEELCREHNPYCDWYVFKQESDSGFNSVYGANGWYYESQFGPGMPDLNLDNEELREEILKISKFWIDLGVKGYRLDTVINYYTGNPTKNAEFLNWFSSETKKFKEDVYIVAEAWVDRVQISNYYYEKAELTSVFNFPFGGNSGSITTCVNQQKGAGLAKAIVDWDATIHTAYEGAIDAPFLSNHDLTRSASALTGRMENIKQAAAVYLLMPGNPFIYYGEELAMKGGADNDPNKRAPFIWSKTDTTGQCNPPAGASEPREVEMGVAESLAADSSLLKHYINLIAIRNTYPALARGTTSVVDGIENTTVCAYDTTYEGTTLRIIHNFGDEPYTFELEEGQSLLEAIACLESAPTVEGTTVTMPARSSAIIG